MLQSLDGAAVRRWALTCCDVLEAHRDEIDALNVFPVPDQDTGSNLLATMRSGLDAVIRDPEDDQDVSPGSVVAMLARGALLGAKGNSGVILSQVLRGLAEPLLREGPGSLAPLWDGAALREGLRRADELAMAAVSDPVPGTVLTVLHAAAQAAAAVRTDELAEVASAATVAAADALVETPRQLTALAVAGVVDAGGRGLILLLEALLAVVTERTGHHLRAASIAREAGSAHDGSATTSAYEVMYLLDGADGTGVDSLRAELSELGDCVAIVGTGQAWDGPVTPAEHAPVWQVHVHCSDVGAVIEAGIRAGRPHNISVVRFADQCPGAHSGDRHTGQVSHTGQVGHTGQVSAQDRPVRGHAVLALVSGSGVAQLCRRAGAATAPATSSVAGLLGILVGTQARHVTLLAEPCAVSTAEAAAAAAREAGRAVAVLPAQSPVQVLAALAVHDGARLAVADRVAMTGAAQATRCGELTRDRAAALTPDASCQASDFLGILGDQVVLINSDLLAAASELVARLLAAGGELVTVLLGQDAPDGLADALREQLRRAHPEVEMAVYAGEVPRRVLLVGVE